MGVWDAKYRMQITHTSSFIGFNEHTGTITLRSDLNRKPSMHLYIMLLETKKTVIFRFFMFVDNKIMKSQVWIEASIVSAIFLVLFHIVKNAFIFDNVYIQVVLTGFLGHVFMEAVRINKYYCESRNK